MRTAALGVAFIGGASAFYLPGVAPRDYLPGEKVELKVNKLTSTKTQCVVAARLSAHTSSQNQLFLEAGLPASRAPLSLPDALGRSWCIAGCRMNTTVCPSASRRR